LNRGVSWHNLNKPENALADYNEVIRRDPNYALAYMKWRRLAAERGQKDKANEDDNEAIRLNPILSEAHINCDRLLNE